MLAARYVSRWNSRHDESSRQAHGCPVHVSTCSADGIETTIPLFNDVIRQSDIVNGGPVCRPSVDVKISV